MSRGQDDDHDSHADRHRSHIRNVGASAVVAFIIPLIISIFHAKIADIITDATPTLLISIVILLLVGMTAWYIHGIAKDVREIKVKLPTGELPDDE